MHNRHCERKRSNPVLKLVCLLLVLSVSACSKPVDDASKLRLGYLLNASHAVPITGLESGKFSNTRAQYFSSGGYLLNALITKNLDLAYIGPGPYLNAISKGVKLKVLALSSLGGNSLILDHKYKPGKTYKIKRLAVPQLGNTQDLLAKYIVGASRAQKDRYKTLSPEMKSMLEAPKVKFSKRLEYLAVNPAEIETIFAAGDIDAALVAEPWGSLLEQRSYINLSKSSPEGALSLIQELDGDRNSFIQEKLVEINRFPAALLVVDEDFYSQHQQQVDKFLKQQNQILESIQADRNQAARLITEHLRKITKQDIQENFIALSLRKLKFGTELDQAKLESLRQIAIDHKYIRNAN